MQYNPALTLARPESTSPIGESPARVAGWEPMLPFVLRGSGLGPASASTPFVATVVDVTGLVIYFAVASVILRGTLL